MEFPGLGKHCSEPTCHMLDFLPVKCDACSKIFCHNHMSYIAHNCIEGSKRNYQVPVCPLCNKPVPSKREQAPDIAVSDHIDADCQSDKAKNRRKVYVNRCHYKNCKKKEMMPLKCTQCGKNYCLTHRHQTDHECVGNQANNRNNRNHPSKPRQQPESPYRSLAQHIQGSMSEDEALARALQLSLASNNPPPTVNTAGRISSGSIQNNTNCVIS